MKAKWVIWGTGERAKNNLNWLYKIKSYIDEFDIIAIVDNSLKMQGKDFEGLPIYAPKDLLLLEYDYIAIWSNYSEEIRLQIINELNIQEEKIANIFSPWVQKLRLRHCGEGKEITDFINMIEDTGKMGVYYFQPREEQQEYWQVHYDEKIALYYVNFFGKKMFLKRGYPIQNKNGINVVHNLWREQDLASPHLYTDEYISVKEDDILVDAGTCEGNFALFHIDKIKKAYLVECDAEWMEALEYTFAPYKEKVIFCNKFISNIDDKTHITLDKLVTEQKIDFLKMDIEGEEVNALIGAQRIIRNSEGFKCAICAYHKHGDQERIIQKLNEYGISNTYLSEGYMLFLYDEEILKMPELRKGIVRGSKIN